MMRALIVDDEGLARRRIADLLAQEDDIEVAGECADGEEAVARVQALRPDLVFLDIQMPEMDGFQVLEALDPAHLPVIVFVTAYDEFALRAFEAHAIDYLLKPFHHSRFQVALERARAQVAQSKARGVDERLNALLAALPGRPGYLERFVVRTGTRIQFVRTAEVSWLEADGNYVRLHGARKAHLARATLQQLSARLDPRQFLRIHRSVVVNVARVREVQASGRGSYLLVLEDGTTLTSSHGYRDGVEALISGAA